MSKGIVSVSLELKKIIGNVPAGEIQALNKALN
jgi:hypothetical protein